MILIALAFVAKSACAAGPFSRQSSKGNVAPDRVVDMSKAPIRSHVWSGKIAATGDVDGAPDRAVVISKAPVQKHVWSGKVSATGDVNISDGRADSTIAANRVREKKTENMEVGPNGAIEIADAGRKLSVSKQLASKQSVSKQKAPFLFRWEKEKSVAPLGVLWCEVSKGELFNLGQCASQPNWEHNECALDAYLPNIATYPDEGNVYRAVSNAGLYLVNATTTYVFQDDMKAADGVITLQKKEVAYSRITINDGDDPTVFHQRWTLEKDDTEGRPLLEGDYFLLLDEHGTPTHRWNQYISSTKVDSYNVKASFYLERMNELAQELNVPKDEVWMTIWSTYGINPDTGLVAETD